MVGVLLAETVSWTPLSAEVPLLYLTHGLRGAGAGAQWQGSVGTEIIGNLARRSGARLGRLIKETRTALGMVWSG
jgi:hypothetical protein